MSMRIVFEERFQEVNEVLNNYYEREKLGELIPIITIRKDVMGKNLS